MDEKEKVFLMSIINLDAKLKTNDKSVAADIAFIKEHIEEKGSDKEHVYNLIVKHIDQNDPYNKDLLRYAVIELGLENQDYLLTMIRMPSSNDKDQIRAFVDSVLSEDIVITDPATSFNFYQRIIFLAVQTGDSSLPERAIKKIQAL